jgi:hypothetical protein
MLAQPLALTKPHAASGKVKSIALEGNILSVVIVIVVKGNRRETG